MSWEPTVPYYQTINRVVGERMGGRHSARLVLYSADFHDIERLQHAEPRSDAGEILAGAARAVERSGDGSTVLVTTYGPRNPAAAEVPAFRPAGGLPTAA